MDRNTRLLRARSFRFLQAIVAAVNVAALVVGGCDRADGPPSRARGAPTADVVSAESRVDPAELSPTETIELLRRYRTAGKYSRIETHLPPDQRALVIAQIRAVDRLAAAAALLHDRVQEHFGVVAARPYERYAHVGNVAGVFSADVALLSERVDGDRAVIRYQVADRLPLETAHLARRENGWVLIADPIDGVPEQLLKLAFLLERMAGQVMKGDVSAEQLDAEIKLRQSTILRRLQELTAAPADRD